MPTLTVHSAGPGVSLQDMGRPGFAAQGLSTGGATDRLALLEAAAILGTPPAAALEMFGFGGTFTTDTLTRIVLTGAQMQAQIAGNPVKPNISTLLRPGEKLTIGGTTQGSYGYLSFAGGITQPPVMGSRSTHLTAGIGRALRQGDTLPIGHDPRPLTGPMCLPRDDRFCGGVIRVMPGPQTDFFDAATLVRFQETSFTRSPRANRQGVRLDQDGSGFTMTDGHNIPSDAIVSGDVQMTGDGIPYVLLSECQTIGGYPRIATVIPADLPKLAQAAVGAKLQFQWLTVAQADATAISDTAVLRALVQSCTPVVRDPHDIADLLSYQLISGVTAGNDG